VAALTAFVATLAVSMLVWTVAIGGADTASPPDWAPSDWAQLSPADQTLELTDYDDGTGDPSGKAAWLQSSPEQSLDAEANADAAADGPGHPVTTGILDTRWSPFPSDQYIWENEWQDFNSAHTVLTQVFAGRRASDVNAELLLVNDIPDASPHDVIIGTLTEVLGRGAGSIRIAGATSTYLTVFDSLGTGTFYLRSRTLVWDSE
jgi:hypothetical protein